MKYIYILTLLVFLSLESNAEIKTTHYFCKMNTKFYETDKNEWSQKNIDYEFYVENNINIKIFDRQIKDYIDTLDILINNEEALVGYYLDDKMKLKLNTKYMNLIANKIGNDVPIILKKKNSFLNGKRGKIVRSNKKFKLNLLVVYPNIACSTKKVFQNNKKMSSINPDNVFNFIKCSLNHKSGDAMALPN